MQYHFNLDILLQHHSLTLLPRFAKCLHVACERVAIFQWEIFEKATLSIKNDMVAPKRVKGPWGEAFSHNTLLWDTSFLKPINVRCTLMCPEENRPDNPGRPYAPFLIFFCRLTVHTHIDPVQLWVLCRGTSFPQFLHQFSVSKLNYLFAFYCLNPLASRVSGGNDMWRLLWSCHPCAEQKRYTTSIFSFHIKTKSRVKVMTVNKLITQVKTCWSF